MMAVGDTYVFPGFLTPVLTQLFFPKPPTTFLTCFCRGERRKYARKKSHLIWGSNSQPPDHESDTLTTEPPGRGWIHLINLTTNSKIILPREFKKVLENICEDIGVPFDSSSDNNLTGDNDPDYNNPIL